MRLSALSSLPSRCQTCLNRGFAGGLLSSSGCWHVLVQHIGSNVQAAGARPVGNPFSLSEPVDRSGLYRWRWLKPLRVFQVSGQCWFSARLIF